MVIVGLGLASIVGAIFFIWLGVRRLRVLASEEGA